MAATAPFPYAIIKTKNPFYARSSSFRRRVNFKSLDHARNYCRKAVKPEWHRNSDKKWVNLNKTLTITVWVSPTEYYLWRKFYGWSEKEQA